MSYAYDVMHRVFEQHCRPLLKQAGKERLADLLFLLIEAMHSANHKVPSANGTFKGDGVNKDPWVSKAARELDEHARALARKEPAP